MSERRFNVLILCTGNSARSVLAEGLLSQLGAPAGIRAFSAGSRPRGEVHPMALRVLEAHGIPTLGLRSKSWDEFALSSAPKMDVVVTVCDSAAGETCPLWPGTPTRLHWGLDDPAAVIGSDAQVRAAFERTFAELQDPINRLIEVAVTTTDPEAIRTRLQQITVAAA
jgi:arsenate reductase